MQSFSILVIFLLTLLYFNLSFCWSQQISTGFAFTCVVYTTIGNYVTCFGDNQLQELNLGLYNETSFIQISSSPVSSWSCGITTDYTIKCWPLVWENYFNIDQNQTFAQITGGKDHICGITYNISTKALGNTLCYGENNYGQLIVPSTDDHFVSIASGSTNNCGILQNGTAVCFGSNLAGESWPPDNKFIQIACANSFCCGIINYDSSVVCWGNQTQFNNINGTIQYIQLSCAYTYCCGIDNSGFMSCFGENIPFMDGFILSQTFVQVSCGTAHCCALNSFSAYLDCWGSDTYGQISPPRIIYTQLLSGPFFTCGIIINSLQEECWGGSVDELGESEPLQNDKAMLTAAAGYAHQCAVLVDGSLECWGSNEEGEGLPPSGNNFVTISAGYLESCSLTTNKTAICWGYGMDSTPLDNGAQFLSIEAGGIFVCGILLNGELICRGDNSFGSLAIPFKKTTQVLQVACDQIYSCAILSNHSVVCWGFDNVNAGILYPPSVLFSFISISTYHAKQCGIVYNTSGSVVCWGSSAYGELVPPTGKYYASISAGYEHTCGLEVGTSKTSCWGYNFAGQTAVYGPDWIAVGLAPQYTYTLGSIQSSCIGSYSSNFGYITPLCSGGCNAGYYGNGSSSSCSAICPIAHYCPFYSSEPIPCPVGHYGDRTHLTTSDCSGLCSAGYYCLTGSPSPTQYLCPSGYYGNKMGESRVNCSGLCSAGFYCPEGTISPTQYPCSPGYYSGIGASSCSVCPSGKYSINFNSSSCTDCPGGYFSPNPLSITCFPCSSGRFSTEGSNNCQDCSAGYYNPYSNATTCLACLSGYYNPSISSSKCTGCLPGRYSLNGSETCNDCDPGYYSNQNASLCIECSPGSFNPFPGGYKCLTCPSGYYSSNSSSVECILCDSGSYGLSNGLGCQSCDVGKYQNLQGEILCFICPSGTYSNSTGSTYCASCSIGTYSNIEIGAITGASQCSNCEAGKYLDRDNGIVCINCETGYYSSSSGSSICNVCLSPLVVINNQTACVSPVEIILSKSSITSPSSYESISSIAIILFVLLIVLTLVYLSRTATKANSPWFELLINYLKDRSFDFIQIIGILLMLFSIFPFISNETHNSSGSCSAFLWLFILGFTIHHVSLFGQTRSLIVLLTTKGGDLNNIYEKAFKPAYQLLLIAFITQFIYLIIWQSVSPLESTNFSVDSTSEDNGEQILISTYNICWSHSEIAIFELVVCLLFSCYCCYYGFEKLISLKSQVRGNNNNNGNSQELMSFRLQFASVSPVIVLLFSEILTLLLIIIGLVVSVLSPSQLVNLFPNVIPILILIYSLIFLILYCFSHSSEIYAILRPKSLNNKKQEIKSQNSSVNTGNGIILTTAGSSRIKPPVTAIADSNVLSLNSTDSNRLISGADAQNLHHNNTTTNIEGKIVHDDNYNSNNHNINSMNTPVNLNFGANELSISGNVIRGKEYELHHIGSVSNLIKEGNNVNDNNNNTSTNNS